MARSRKSSPQKARRQLDAELERLSVPEAGRPARDGQAAEEPTESEAEDERIRRMIEAAYT